MTPLARYRQDLGDKLVMPDPDQLQAMERLDEVYHMLVRRWQKQAGIVDRLLGYFRTGHREPVPGLYLWGGVGRGKTYLMDLFFQCLPAERKMRMHFHRFMQLVHAGLQRHRGEPNPLQGVAEEIATDVDVICFDEFFVSDIGDAMILANLLQTLFANGVCLVATSNIEPERLYENGLQRQKFLPAIALIKQYTRVINIAEGLDYRLRNLEQAEIYHSPLGPEADALMHDCFQSFSGGQKTEDDKVLEILGRSVRTRCWAEGLAWFEFEQLCGGPRSAADYIELARLFHTVLLADVPAMDGSSDDKTRRFISLVDEFYDHNVKLIISAAVPLTDLYTGTELAFPFQRTMSRLLEMQSHDYLAREHAP